MSYQSISSLLAGWHRIVLGIILTTLLGVVTSSPLAAAVTDESRFMEPNLRAIQERFYMVTGSYWVMPPNEKNEVPGEYPPNGFYDGIDLNASAELWNQALAVARIAISGFVENPDAIDGALSDEELTHLSLPPINGPITLNTRLRDTLDALRKCEHLWFGINGLDAPVAQLRIQDRSIVQTYGDPYEGETNTTPSPETAFSSMMMQSVAGASSGYFFFPYYISNTIILRGDTRGFECQFDLSRFPGKGTIFYSMTWYNADGFSHQPPTPLPFDISEVVAQRTGPSMTPVFGSGYGPTWLDGPAGYIWKSRIFAGTNPVIGGSLWSEQLNLTAAPSLVSGFGADDEAFTYDYDLEGILLSVTFEHPVTDTFFLLTGYVIEDSPEGCPAPTPGTHSAGNSLIDNGALAYYHDAWDYRVDPTQSGCTSCGAVRDLQGAARFAVGRFHRYRDLDWGASFGPGVMSNYDLRLEFHAQDQVARFFDPQRRAVCELDGVTGTYLDQQGITNGIVLKDAQGMVVSDVAQARTAILSHRDGRRLTFEIFSTDPDPVTSGYYCGRLTRSEDLNGFATILTYQDADPTVSSEELGMDRMRLWRFQTVTDPYQTSATFAWSRVGGQWVISTVTLPDGEALAYRYDTSHLVALNQIIYPTGEISTFATSWDQANQVQQVIIDDAGAEGSHRNKTVSLTPSVVSLGGGLMGPQLPDLVRKVVNRAGEVSYQNWFAQRGDTSVTYLYEGGGERGDGKLRRNDVRDGKPVGTSTALSFDLTKNFATFVWQSDISSETDAEMRPTKRTATDGTYTTYVRSSVGDILTKTLHRPDGSVISVESTTWNEYQLPTSYTDASDRVTEWVYDDHNNLLSKTVGVGTPEAGTWRYTYNARGQILTSTDANDHTTSYVYDDTTGLLLNVVEPGDFPGDPNPTRTLTYDAAGRLASSEDQSGHVVTYEYDGRGRRITTTYGDGSTEEMVYGTGDDANLVVRRKDRNNVWDDIGYDAAGRKTSLVRADGRPDRTSETWDYLPGKDLISAHYRSGHVTRFDYDSRLRPVATSKAATSTVVHTTSSHTWDDLMASMTTDAYGRRTFSLQTAGGLRSRQVHELVIGALELYGEPAEVVQALWTLERSPASNPAYVLTEAFFNAAGQRISQSDARGIVSTFTYDGQGRLASQVEVDRLADGSLNPQAARTEFGYDPQGNQVAVIKPRSFTRDADGVFVMGTDVFASASSYTARNLVASVTDGAGSADAATIWFTYTPTGRKASQSDPRDPTWLTTYLYAACCDRLETIVDPLGHQTHLVTDAIGNTTAATDANGIPATMAYDAHQRVIQQVNGAGDTTTFVHDDDLSDGVGIEAVFPAAVADLGLGAGAPGSAVAVTDPEQAVTIEIRDGLGRVVRRVDANGNAGTTTYDVIEDGLVATLVTDPLGNTMRSMVDTAGRARVQVDAAGQRTVAAYDAAGNLLATRDPNGVGADMTYDARGRVLASTDTAGASMTMAYDLHSNVTSATDALGKVTLMTYDHRDRKQTTTDRIQGTTAYGYDHAGNLTGMTDAEGRHTSYQFDRRNLLEEEIHPAGAEGSPNERAYTYDPGRRLLTRTDQAGVTTTYGYDLANRLTSRTYSDGAIDELAYDRTGRLTQAVSGRYATTIDREFDPAGRLTTEWQRIAGRSYQVSHGYDAANRATRLTYPDGRVVTRSFTTRSQLQSVALDGASVATRSYDAGGRLMTTQLGNGLSESRTYVPGDHLLQTLSVPGVTGFTYQYDATKAKTHEADAALADEQSFSYDDEKRLTSWSRIGDTQQWLLSKVGDWQTITRNGTLETRTHSPAHEVTSLTAGGVTIPVTYDARGNLNRDQAGTSYVWDPENRLQAAVIPATGDAATLTATYRYDALGRRLEKRVGSAITTFIHDGEQVISEWESPVLVTAPAQIASDGDGSTTPGDAPTPGEVLTGEGITRINAQPEQSPIPSGFFADKGRPYWVRTNGKTYGWDDADTATPQARHVHPWPQYDTGIRFATTPDAPAATWAIGELIPGETYAVVAVFGNPLSTDLTNDIAINGIGQIDPDPAHTTTGYHKGDFDGYAETITIGADGLLVIAALATARNPTLCFVEIGPAGSQITEADRDRLDEMIQAATDQTGALPKPPTAQQTYVYADGIDEPLALLVDDQRFYYHANHLRTIAALTDATGRVVERYRYDAYGKRTALRPEGVPLPGVSAIGNRIGFTGRYLDEETGLAFFRARQYSSELGRFISRDPSGYVDGGNLYSAYFVPNQVDPSGNMAESVYSACVKAYLLLLGSKKVGESGCLENETDQSKLAQITSAAGNICQYVERAAAITNNASGLDDPATYFSAETQDWVKRNSIMLMGKDGLDSATANAWWEIPVYGSMFLGTGAAADGIMMAGAWSLNALGLGRIGSLSAGKAGGKAFAEGAGGDLDLSDLFTINEATASQGVRADLAMAAEIYGRNKLLPGAVVSQADDIMLGGKLANGITQIESGQAVKIIIRREADAVTYLDEAGHVAGIGAGSDAAIHRAIYGRIFGHESTRAGALAFIRHMHPDPRERLRVLRRLSEKRRYWFNQTP